MGFLPKTCGQRTKICYFLHRHDTPQPKSAETVPITIVLYNTCVELLFKYVYILPVSRQVQAGWNLMIKTIHLSSSVSAHTVRFCKPGKSSGLFVLCYLIFKLILTVLMFCMII